MENSDQSAENQQQQEHYNSSPANSEEAASNSASSQPPARADQSSLSNQSSTTLPPTMGHGVSSPSEQAYPPPTYYQQELDKLTTSSPSLPSEQPIQPASPPPVYPGSVPPPPGGQWLQPPPGYPVYPQGTSYAGLQPPPFFPAPPPRKKRRTWLIFLIIGLVVLILGSCGLCTWASAPIFEQAFNQATDMVSGTQNLVDDYYGSLQNQAYDQAFFDIHPSGSIQNLTQTTYTQQAKEADTRYGPIKSYTPQSPSYTTTDGTIDSVTIKVDITRPKESYTAQLKLQKVNNQWKIVDYDHL